MTILTKLLTGLGKGHQHQKEVDKKASKRNLDTSDDGESKRAKGADGTATSPVDTSGSSASSSGADTPLSGEEQVVNEKTLDRDEKERDAVSHWSLAAAAVNLVSSKR